MVKLQQFKDIPLSEKPKKPNKPIPLSVVEPQKALVPIFNSPFYLTPDEPADPRDCDRYPDSLFCGGVPWTFTPIGIEPSIVIDECNIGIELKPVLGYTLLPPVQLVYRKQTEECRNPSPDKEFEPPEDLNDYNLPLKFRELGCNQGVFGAFCTEFEYYEEYCSFDYNLTFTKFRRYNSYYHDKFEILEVNFPYKVKYKHLESNELAYFHMKVKETHIVRFNQEIDKFKLGFNTDVAMALGSRSASGEQIVDYWMYYDQNIININPSISFLSDEFKNLGHSKLFNNSPQGLQYLKSQRNMQTFGAFHRVGDNNRKYVSVGYIKSIKTPFQLCLDKPKIYFPPIPRQKECDCIMTCCPDTKLNDQLLRMLIQKVDILSKVVGVDDYPVSLPTSLISKDEGFLGNLIPNVNQDVPSLTRFLAWYVSRFDEIMGQWEIPIEIKDSDPTKPGEQPVGIKLPNMAEAIAEMFTLAFQTNINSETLLNISMRTMADAAADKKQNFISYKLLQSLTDYVGFKQKDIKLKMPLLFTLGKTEYDEILKESEVDVGCVEFDDKFGLEADLMRFREAAAILAAVHKKKIDPKGDIKAQVLKYLLDTLTATNKVNTDEEDDNFEQFIEDVETGFTNAPGMKDAVNPYGRPFTQRPKIRDLTKYVPPTNP